MVGTGWLLNFTIPTLELQVRGIQFHPFMEMVGFQEETSVVHFKFYFSCFLEDWMSAYSLVDIFVSMLQHINR